LRRKREELEHEDGDGLASQNFMKSESLKSEVKPDNHMSS